MSTRNIDECVTELESYTRTKWLHAILVNLDVDHSIARYKKRSDALDALVGIAKTHPNLLSLAIDAFLFDDEDDAGAQHPQMALLPSAPNGSWEVFPADAIADLLFDTEQDIYADGVAASDSEEELDDSAKLAQALAAIKQMRGAQAKMQKDFDAERSSFEQRARATAAQLIRDANAGLAKVSVVTTRESARERHAVTSFSLSPSFAIVG